MYESLTKGLAVYRQNHTKSIYVRCRVDGREIKRSLKTSNLDDAKSKAWALKFELEGMKLAGLDIPVTKNITIIQCSIATIKIIENKNPHKKIYDDYVYLFKTFIIPYFKRKSISELTTKNIRLFFESHELSTTRYRMFKTCFNYLFYYLEEENFIEKKDIPTLPDNNNKIKTEIGFNISPDDIKTISDFLNSDEFQNQSGLKPNSIEYRKLLPHVFNFYMNTGLRSGEEFKNIRFSDFEFHNFHLFCKIRKGKTSYKTRDILLNESATNSILDIISITKNKNFTKDKLTKIKDDFVFKSSFGNIPHFDNFFNQAINKLINQNKIGKKYTFYCCRHTYISSLLASGVDMYLISKQVGNSLEMIQKHYDHSMVKDSKNVYRLLGYTEDEFNYFHMNDDLSDEQIELNEINNFVNSQF